MNIGGDPVVEVARMFPYGAQAATENPNQPDFKLVKLEVRQLGNGWVLAGWAYPNKDMFFDLDTATVTPRGWTINKGSTNYLLSPLPQAVGEALLANVNAV